MMILGRRGLKAYRKLEREADHYREKNFDSMEAGIKTDAQASARHAVGGSTVFGDSEYFCAWRGKDSVPEYTGLTDNDCGVLERRKSADGFIA